MTEIDIEKQLKLCIKLCDYDRSVNWFEMYSKEIKKLIDKHIEERWNRHKLSFFEKQINAIAPGVK